MNTVITYDIVGNKRRTRFHKFLKELGIRSQYSVFECRLDLRPFMLIDGGFVTFFEGCPQMVSGHFPSSGALPQTSRFFKA